LKPGSWGLASFNKLKPGSWGVTSFNNLTLGCWGVTSFNNSTLVTGVASGNCRFRLNTQFFLFQNKAKEQMKQNETDIDNMLASLLDISSACTLSTAITWHLVVEKWHLLITWHLVVEEWHLLITTNETERNRHW
jgi:hypothetical protein